MTTSKNELTINTGAAIGNQLLPDLFQDIDLDGMNNAIDNIGSVSGKLQPEEKALARDIIGEWNESVVGRLKTRSQQMQGVIYFFDARSASQSLNGQDLEEFGPELAAQTGTTNELEVVLKANQDLINLELSEPEQPIESKEDTYEDRIKSGNAYKAAVSIHNIDERKLERKRDAAVGAFKRALLANNDIKLLVKEAKKSFNGTDKLVHMTREKGQLAKLNISISSVEARDALKELVSFTKNI